MMTRIIIIFESIIFPLIADLSREVGRFENPAYESTGWVLHSVLTNTLLTIDDCENVSDILTKSKCNNYE